MTLRALLFDNPSADGADLTAFLQAEAIERCDPDQLEPCQARLAAAQAELARVASPAYRDSLWGSLGADWVSRTH